LSAAFLRVLPHLFASSGGQMADSWVFTNPTNMSIEVTGKLSRNEKKTWYTFEWGKDPGQRIAANVFTYAKPQSQIQKNHNKEALALLETKKSQLTIEQQSTGTPFIPVHKFKNNFLDYYAQFAQNNEKEKKHLHKSLDAFKRYILKPQISPIEITENFCSRFRTYLLEKFNGATPSNYFGAFKRVVKVATKEGYFRNNPAEDLKRKSNPPAQLKEFLEADELVRLIDTPIKDIDIRDAFIFCCYTGLRFCDVKALKRKQIKGEQLVTTIIQAKTQEPVQITLHPMVKTIMDERRKKHALLQNRNEAEVNGQDESTVFAFQTFTTVLEKVYTWVKDAGIEKNITWHSARLTFAILLQDAGVDPATVAILLGHTTTQYVLETYKRHRPKSQETHINKLPYKPWKYTE
jgi:integrase